ncbi:MULTISPECIES: MFS transporter [Micromonospora]|uniref:Drug resistance transporter, EmrB/QacA subfamily n=1 Tax=Micromonospora yangpuensis TaxID=683228 RepID=A0A1C6UKJ0_9ACTN|nr:MFS transporter [Micromonospora yangpuensis]GGM16909.1 MFS transporter [Micromonospora yangpuensis]SCL54464.1 drug resistance transporter, EmrB/QacA subfamily [Micromonospora yangpuensis]
MSETITPPTAVERDVSAPSAQPGGKPRWIVMPVILAATFMVALDFFIVNVAIPSTQRELGASPAAIQFIIAGYWLSLATGLIICGRLGDLYGRKRIFLVGLACFTAASAACGLAPSAEFLVGARIVQGLSASLMMPQGLAILGVVYTGAARARAFTAYAVTLGLASVSGQLVGGLLIEADILGLSWRNCYLVNVPIGLLTIALALRYVPESRATTRTRLDFVGTVLIAAGLVALVLPLVEGRERGWPLWTWITLAAAVPLLITFARHQSRLGARDGGPLIDMRLFRERAFSVGLVVTVLFNMLMGSFFLFLAIYLQAGRGMSALESGLIFTPIGVGYFVASLLAEPIAARIGRHVLTIGAVVMLVGLGLTYLMVDRIGVVDGAGVLIPAFALAGAGMGLVLAPLTNTVLTNINPEYAGAAAGVLATSQQVGGAVGVAIVGVVFYNALGSRTDPGAYPPAFLEGLVWLVAFTVAIGLLIQLLPRRRPVHV